VQISDVQICRWKNYTFSFYHLQSEICTPDSYRDAHLTTFKIKNMFDKLMQAQQMAGEVKKRLDTIIVSGVAEGGKIKVTANGNKVVQAIAIDEAFLKEADKEELEDLLVVAINKALEQADNVSQTEMAAMTKEMLGGMGRLF
jgi:nucleoid-associated protein EbfC